MNNIYVVDLDGTLLKNGKLTEYDKMKLKQIQKDNILIIATGRKYCEAQEIISELDLAHNGGKVILADGQYLIDYSNDEESVSEFLSIDDLKFLFLNLKDCISEMRVISDICDFVVFESKFNVKYLKNKKKYDEDAAKPLFISKIKNEINIEKIVFWNSAEIDINRLNNLKQKYELNYISDKKRWEIKKKGVNKAEMLNQLKNKYHYSDEKIFVFGNDENDLAMFEQYKNSFVMFTAEEKLKLKAYTIIDDVVKQIELIEGD